MTRPAESGTERDPGLQAERTLLAWQRTVIVLVVVALLYVRDPFQAAGAQHAGPEPLLRAAVALVPVGIAVAAAVHVRRRWRAGRRGGRDGAAGGPAAPLAQGWMRILISAGTCVFAVAVAVSALIG
ncbi:DUF202 domain-containing protein [Nocardiopsis composta]|uniref:Uncharacterized membrane protein YidH (DUF202 family) n=1 Tax=Nocardiopsis composta TaxID=157465 RepID=A0A7W8QP89_9ACTN|nr:DUF202 domain-containing protein [Nocardiopsis composta]MBB5433368.1 uncharacterized membrane protein YidH (DUF202 family) [Nocardiopsis composta]